MKLKFNWRISHFFNLPLPFSLPNTLITKPVSFSDVTLLADMEFMLRQDHSGFHLYFSSFPSGQEVGKGVCYRQKNPKWHGKVLMCPWNQMALGCVWVTRSLEHPSRRENTAECTREDPQEFQVTSTTSKVSVPFYRLEHEEECHNITANVHCFLLVLFLVNIFVYQTRKAVNFCEKCEKIFYWR